MEKRLCDDCKKTPLNQYNPGILCNPCQEKRVVRLNKTDDPNYNTSDLAYLLGLDNVESVRRLARFGKLPPSIPHIRRLLWPKDVIDTWIRQGHPRHLTIEVIEAIHIALIHSYPIDQSTSYGNDYDRLISSLKSVGLLPDNKNKH